MFKAKGSLRKSDYWSVTGHMLTIALWVELTWKQRETLMMQSLEKSSFICMAHGNSSLNMMHFVYNVVYISLCKRCHWIQICRTCSLAHQLTFEWETEKKDCEKCIFWTSYVLFIVFFTVSAEKRETETQINSKRHLYEARRSFHQTSAATVKQSRSWRCLMWTRFKSTIKGGFKTLLFIHLFYVQ